ncbi:TPA: hypothetical protein J1Z65_004010 [Escherichia coli]|nr:hypothetical protein [Escherichia coli]
MEKTELLVHGIVNILTDTIRGERRLDEMTFYRIQKQLETAPHDEWREYAYALLSQLVKDKESTIRHFRDSLSMAPHEPVAYNYLMCLKCFVPHCVHMETSIQLAREFKSVRILKEAYRDCIEMLSFERAEDVIRLCVQFSPEEGENMRNDINEVRASMEKFMLYGNMNEADVRAIANDMIDVANANEARIVSSEFVQIKEHWVNSFTMYVCGVTAETMADMQFQLADKLAVRNNLSPVNFSAGFMDGDALEREYVRQ